MRKGIHKSWEIDWQICTVFGDFLKQIQFLRSRPTHLGINLLCDAIEVRIDATRKWNASPQMSFVGSFGLQLKSQLCLFSGMVRRKGSYWILLVCLLNNLHYSVFSRNFALILNSSKYEYSTYIYNIYIYSIYI